MCPIEIATRLLLKNVLTPIPVREYATNGPRYTGIYATGCWCCIQALHTDVHHRFCVVSIPADVPEISSEKQYELYTHFRFIQEVKTLSGGKSSSGESSLNSQKSGVAQ